MKELRANRYHFKKMSEAYASGIRFLLPDALKDDFDQELAYHDNSFVRSSPALGIYFSVDAFDDDETGSILATYEAGSDSLEVIHDFFIKTRLKSLSESNAELSMATRLSGSKEGLYSTIQESNYGSYVYDATYQVASIRHKQAFYVFQFICSNELAPYMYTDFHRIIQSAH